MATDCPSLVELLGQPGAGKTTLARAAAPNSGFLSRADLGTSWRRLSPGQKASFAAQAALDGACLGHAVQLVTKIPLRSVDSLSRLARLLIKSHWFRSQRGLLLLEEGALQDLWSIFYSADRMAPDPRLIAPLIHCLYRGMDAKIVLLMVDPQTAVDRIPGRAEGKSRFDRLSEADLRMRLVETAQLPLKIAEAARLAGLSVDTLDASEPTEVSARRLREIMRKG